MGVKRGGRGGCMFLKKRGDIKKGQRKKKGGLIHLYALWLDKLQNWICRTVGPSLAASLELLTHIWNVASLILFYRHYFGRCSSELNWLNWFLSLILEGGLPVILIDCIIFLSPFLNVVRMSMSIVSFPRTAKLWNSLPVECFPLTYDLNGFKSRINRLLLTVSSFWTDFLYALIFFFL